MPDYQIRQEQPADVLEIRAVHEAAFGRPDEAALVEALRREGAVFGSFVSVYRDRVVGHVLFTRTVIGSPPGEVMSVALAPLAVSPAYQQRGIASELVRTGLAWLRSRGEHSVLVLGEPRFYSRFGFSCTRAATLKTPFPPEAYMALELVPNALDGVNGAVRYASAFGL